MDLTDLGRIVVDQTNGSCVKWTLNSELFAHFSLNSVLKRLYAECKCKERMIFVIDVSSDTNGSFGNQTLFAGLLAANIVKNALAVSYHHVRDDLFELRVGLCVGTGQKPVVLVQDRWQIAIDISTETLKNTKLLEKRTRKN